MSSASVPGASILFITKGTCLVKSAQHQGFVSLQQDAMAKIAKLSKHLDDERSLNEQLTANQKAFQKQLEQQQQQLTAKDAALQDLQEQVRDLMVYIEAQRTIEQSGELQEATLLPVPAAAAAKDSKSKRRSSRK